MGKGGLWTTFPTLASLFAYNGSGVMPGRTWIIAPDKASLEDRWKKLKSATADEMEILFHPHLDGDGLGDRHTLKILKDSLHGFPLKTKSVAGDASPMVSPLRYGFRSFDRQWIIPDTILESRDSS